MSNQNSKCPKRSLCDVCCGTTVCIAELHGEPWLCHRLREMGLHETAFVKKISDNGALIVGVRDNHIALSEQLARNIIVEEI